MPKLRNRIVAGLAIGALLLAIAPVAGASAAAPSATGASARTGASATGASAADAAATRASTTQPAFSYYRWGWVTVRQPATSVYTPAAIDRGNSEGRPNVVKRLSTGQWRITFNGLGDDGGVAHVTTLGTQARICQIGGWGRGTGSKQNVLVNCYRMSNGTFANTKFSVSYLATNNDAGPMAYLFANGGVAEEDANPQYSFNSAVGTNHISRTGVGSYEVTLGGLGAAAGHPQVTARNSFAAEGATCNVGSWGGGTDQSIDVMCWDRLGAATDTDFILSFTDQQGLKGHNTAKVAFLWADQATSASYVPAVFYRYSSAARTPRITRQSMGRYTVKLKGMPVGGAVQVVAYGYDNVRCQLGSIRTSGTPQMVQVRCYDFSNAPVDANFNLSYER